MAGWPEARFWTATPRLRDIHLKAARERSIRQAERETMLAYRTAEFTKAAKLDPPQTYLRHLRPPRRLSNAEIIARLEASMKD